ncbi:MAG: 8-amino-7-oxononanoate synthase [Nitrospirota bacterium]
MFAEKVRLLKEKGLFRTIKDRDCFQGTKIKFGGREFVNFSSNDYLGLANHPHLIEKVKKTLDECGYGAGASRLLSGGSRLHRELEERVSQFKETESALAFNSGYAANTGIIPAISDEDMIIFSDELNHASIVDGCRLSRSKTYVYRHRDLSHLEELMKKANHSQKIVVTDTIFSMDGDIAPLRELAELCRSHGAFLYLDEAHSTGVLGEGKGSLSHFDMKPEPWIIQMGTFSKALGSTGAFLAASSDAVEWTLNNARSFIYSTALPACVAAASLGALELVENNRSLVEKLWLNRQKLAEGLLGIGCDIMGSETPIIPIRTGDVENTLRVSAHLLEKSIYAPAIRPPTVKESRIRINITAAHTDEDIQRLVGALEQI